MNGSWIKTMSAFLRQDPRVRIMTVHRYPLRNCYVPPSSPQYPTVAHLLSPYSTVTLAASLRRWIAIAHGEHRQLRVDELNSVACRGKTGVSDTFASSLWSVDALFSLLAAGVDGVNVHTLPDAAYELFQFSQQRRAVAGPGAARLLRPAAVRAGGPAGLTAVPAAAACARNAVLSTWATRAPDGTTRVVLIDKDPSRGETVTLRPPPRLVRHGLRVERLQAAAASTPAPGSRWGAGPMASETSTGTLAPHWSRRR